MGELGKVRRVIARQLEGAPHETLLTIDATTGQNGLRQAQLFAETAEVSGVVLTKLDGTARGGIALAIARELALPVKLIGVGESVEDLRPFDARGVRARADRARANLHAWMLDRLAGRGLPSSAWARCTRAASTCCRSRSARRSPRSSACSASARCSRALVFVLASVIVFGDAAPGRPPPPPAAAARSAPARRRCRAARDGARADRQRRGRRLREDRRRRGVDRAQLRRRRGDRRRRARRGGRDHAARPRW